MGSASVSNRMAAAMRINLWERAATGAKDQPTHGWYFGQEDVADGYEGAADTAIGRYLSLMGPLWLLCLAEPVSQIDKEHADADLLFVMNGSSNLPFMPERAQALAKQLVEFLAKFPLPDTMADEHWQAYWELVELNRPGQGNSKEESLLASKLPLQPYSYFWRLRARQAAKIGVPYGARV